MNPKQKNSAPPPASITLRDVYYVLFRHKWLTAVLIAVGVASGLAVYCLWPFPYISEAKLYIRYVQDPAAPVEMEGHANVRSPDDRGANILNTELEMLASLDTAKAAASSIGPEKILGQSIPSGAASQYEAQAGLTILGHLKAEVPAKSDLIVLHYSAKDPALAQQVLYALIAAYKSNYVTNHLSMGFGGDYLQEQTDLAKQHLEETMKTLETNKQSLGVTSMPDSMKNVTDEIYKTQDSIVQLLSDTAETAATIKDLKERLASTATNASQTNVPTSLTPVAAVEPPTPDVLAKYQSLNTALSVKRAEEEKLRSQLTTNNPLVQNAITQREVAEDDVRQFEDHNPGLAAVKSIGAGGVAVMGPAADPKSALEYAETRQHSLAARFTVLTNQLSLLKNQAIKLDAAEDDITKAQTDEEVAEAKYKHYLFSLEQSRIDAGNKALPIITAEQPTPGLHESAKILKAAGGVLGFFCALAFGLPFLIEMVLDQSFKQPMDVKARIDAPFFITIPKTNGRHNLAELTRANPAGLLTANGSTPHAAGEDSGAVQSQNGSTVAPWNERRELRPFFETLRDRLMTYFEMINLTHKPKLVAVTSCSQGAGVTTTAAGLASSLSEIGEGNVLLVNMSARDGEAHHFYKGKRDCQIEEVLAAEKRDQAQVRDHLYVVKEMGSTESLPRVLPKRFSHLVPLMKASDYDYIIFDMPPISEISITPRLARFMDMVLLVIESGKTSHEAGTRAAALLAESKTNVGLVLNKNRSYLPKRLQNM